MGVTSDRTGRARLIHQSQARTRAFFLDVGKGEFISRNDYSSNYHHHHHHHDASTTKTATPKTLSDSRSIHLAYARENYFKTSDEFSNDRRQTGTEQALHSNNQYLNKHVPPLTSTSSSSSLSSTFFRQSQRSLDMPYNKRSDAKGNFLNSSLSKSAHSAHHNKRSNPSHLFSFPSSSSSSSSSGNNNLGSDHIHFLHNYHHGPSHEPLPTTWDVSWNQSDSLCLNKTSGNYDCWELFNPDVNESTTQSGDAFLEEEYRFWTLVLIIIPLLTVFGNVLVVMSVIKEKSLKTVTNYFICSLAVADIMVAVIVMPFAVYMEVMVYRWTLADGLCDAWVASDVLGCTASILNLTAICVDRFIAVTQPIKYAKHKNSKRVFIMLAITWVISVAIAAPIALGVNYSEARNIGDCQFFNSDFIIYSSMGSFYIPSVIMCFLYWKIYRVIRMRALKAKMAKQMKVVDKRTLQGVIENTATTAAQNINDTGGVYGAEATITTGLANIDNGRVMTYNTTNATTSRPCASPPADDSDDNSDDDDDTPSGSGSANNNTSSKDHKRLGVASVVMQISPRFLRSVEVAELITNPMAEEMERRETLENQEHQPIMQQGKNGRCIADQDASASTSGGTGQTCANEAETPFTSVLCKGFIADEKGGKMSKTKGSLKKSVTKFNFHVRASRKRKEKSSSRREKKATKTLAIVLGVFLACWVPFFTLNIIKAICIRYDLKDLPACTVDPIFFSLFQWLGYINSFLNPVIYTIFNQEFRKAFRKLLTDPCR